MRADLDGLPSPHPLASTLPGLYQGQSFVERFCGALDEVLAPVLSTLDNLPAYLDVGTTPDDLLPWLAYWLGVSLDPGQRRAPSGRFSTPRSGLQGLQGTQRGIELAVEAVFGCRALVEETGGADWSLDPGAPLPGQPDAAMVVRRSWRPAEPWTSDGSSRWSRCSSPHMLPTGSRCGRSELPDHPAVRPAGWPRRRSGRPSGSGPRPAGTRPSPGGGRARRPGAREGAPLPAVPAAAPATRRRTPPPPPRPAGARAPPRPTRWGRPRAAGPRRRARSLSCST